MLLSEGVSFYAHRFWGDGDAGVVVSPPLFIK